jgi:hypothetical protein
MTDGVDKVADEMGEAIQVDFGRLTPIPFRCPLAGAVSFARAFTA